MYTVTIYDLNRESFKSYQHIEQIEFYNGTSMKKLSNDELLTHFIPVDTDLFLHAPNANYSISSKLIGAFEIVKES